MVVEVVSFILVVLFGSSSWMGTNSIWMQLPLLTSVLPEGWSLPSYLAMVVQIACIGPLVYGLVHKCCFRISSGALIIGALLLAVLCQSLMAVFWSWTGDSGNSIALYVLLFGLALVNSTSNVLFMPFMAQFHPTLLTAYFVGMGLSSLVPSLLSLVQGTSNYECVLDDKEMKPVYSPPRFGVSVYLWIIAAWTIMATASFALLYWKDRQEEARRRERGEKPVVDETSPLNTARDEERKEEEMAVTTTTRSDQEQGVTGPTHRPSMAGHVFLLFLTALVNAQMNGVIPSVHSYAALPYSQTVYHLGLTLSNIVSPLASFLPMVLAPSSLPVLASLTGVSSLTTIFIVYLATLSPGLLVSNAVGGTLSVLSTMLAAGLHSFLRTLFASQLRDAGGEHGENWLFWCGVFIQIGSFIGSAVMFPLVNFAGVFHSAQLCQA